jgi:hypothetical protein
MDVPQLIVGVFGSAVLERGNVPQASKGTSRKSMAGAKARLRASSRYSVGVDPGFPKEAHPGETGGHALTQKAVVSVATRKLPGAL